MVDAERRDRVEGRYTQVQPEEAGRREVHGRYTGSDGDAGPGSETVGAYVGSERGGGGPLVRSAHLRAGDYPRSER